MSKIVFGIDVGGTTVKCGCFSENGELLEKGELPTRTENSGEYILSDICEYIKNMLSEKNLSLDDVSGVGIGVPGAVKDGKTVNKCVNLGWGRFNVAEKTAGLLGLSPEKIVIGNDANVAALGEYWQGAAKNCSSAMMITIGTGVGGGLIIDGKPVDGFNGAAAEIGHMPLAQGLGFACNCGKTDCLEQIASASGIAKLSGKENAKEVFDAAKAGDEKMEQVVEKASMYIGRALACCAAVADPECFVIGGGVSKAGGYFIEKIRKYYKTQVFYPSRETRIVEAALGNDAGMYGAAKLVLK